MPENTSKGKYILTQLMHHLPYSTFSVMIALLGMGVLSFIVEVAGAHHMQAHAAEDLFHIFHPSHVFISAVASAAMFMKHDGRVVIALCIGFFGSIILCTLSDVILPFFGGMLIGAPMDFHMDILQEPHIILPFAIVGTLAGLAAPQSFEKATESSHSMHVFISSVASILYLIAFGLDHWVHAIGPVFLITIVAVMIPCCLGDIVFPLACSHAECQHGDVTKEHFH